MVKFLVEDFNLDLVKFYFYMDSVVDVLFFEIVGNLCFINLDIKLLVFVFKNNWLVYCFDDEFCLGLVNFVCIGVVLGSLIFVVIFGVIKGVFSFFW